MSTDPLAHGHVPTTPPLLKLENNDRIFSLLVRSVRDYGIFMLDPDGYIVTWNEGAQRIQGYSENEIIGKHFSVFYTAEAVASQHPQHELEIALRDDRYEETGWRVRRDGTRFWANVTITPVYDNGHLSGFAKVTRDLTERRAAKSAKEVAAREQQMFTLLVKSVRDYAIFMLDPTGKVLSWNEGAQRLKGYSEKEIIGQHFSKFYSQELRDRKHPEHELEIAKRDGRYEEEGWRVRKDGSQFWANVVITALYENGELLGFAKVTRDLTEKKQIEEQRERHAKLVEETNEELQHLAYVISHELQAPINTISRYGNLVAVRYKDKLGDDAREFFAKVDESTKLIARMVDDLWNYARITRPYLEVHTVQMNGVVDEALEELKVEIADDEVVVGQLPTIQANRGQMVFLLRELIRNAIRYRSDQPPHIVIDARPQDGGWSFSVQDNGAGIDSIFKSDVFKLFHRIDKGPEPEATGMGLAMCRKVIEQHHGKIWVESEIGAGSTFYFWLP